MNPEKNNGYVRMQVNLVDSGEAGDYHNVWITCYVNKKSLSGKNNTVNCWSTTADYMISMKSKDIINQFVGEALGFSKYEVPDSRLVDKAIKLISEMLSGEYVIVHLVPKSCLRPYEDVQMDAL